MGSSLSSWVASFAVVSSVVAACGGAQPDPATPTTPATTDGNPAAAAGSSPAKVPASAAVGGVGQSCGTRGAAACPKNLYCNYVPGEACGASDKPGHCAEKPEACTADENPACGCDGKTYSNACVANAAGVGVKKSGACP